MKENEYTCAICKITYEKGWSDEEQEKEMLNIWGEIPIEERVIICNGCFNKKTEKEIRTMGNEYKNI